MPRGHRQLRGVIGDPVTARGIALDEIDESRNHAMGWTLRSDVMRRGVLASQHDEHLVQLRAQEIDAVAPVLQQLALHCGESRPHATRGRGCQ